MKKEDKDMDATVSKRRLEEANANFNKILPKIWETARKNTETDKKNYFKNYRNGGK